MYLALSWFKQDKLDFKKELLAEITAATLINTKSLESRIDKVESSLRNEMNYKFADMKADMDAKFAGMHKSNTLRFNQIASGIGIGLEQTSATWLKKYIAAKGYPDAKVVKNYKFKDLLTNEEREVDAICFSPLYILECTGFLKSNELSKLESLVETKAIIERDYNLKCKELLFVTYGIDKDIEKKALKFIQDNDIEFIPDPNI